VTRSCDHETRSKTVGSQRGPEPSNKEAEASTMLEAVIRLVKNKENLARTIVIA
jgi:hypothetical protein